MRSLDEVLRAMPDYRPEGLRVEQARSIIGALVQPVRETERLALRSALGRVLAEDIVSPIDVPGHDSAAMDGWALRGCDLSETGDTELSEIGAAFAGRPFTGELGPHECVRIMTGAVMPRGSDTVVMQEVVRANGSQIVVPAGQHIGMHRRAAGDDVARGEAALHQGLVIGPAAIGLAASLGVAQVNVRRTLRVAFFSTGDELTPLGEPLRPGQVYDSNRHALWAMLTRLGCEAIDLGVVADEPHLLQAALTEGIVRADAVVTTGGASEGEADFTRQIAARLGEVAFWKLALRPGRPFAFGDLRVGDNTALFFGLPGNPVAAMVAFYRLVRPALLVLAGASQTDVPMLRARCLEGVPKRLGREEVLRAVLERGSGGPGVRLTGPQGSGRVSSMCEADCLVVLPPEVAEVRAGDPVDVILLEGLA